MLENSQLFVKITSKNWLFSNHNITGITGSYVLMMKDESAKMFWNIKKQITKLEFELHMTTYLTQKCWEVLGKD